MSDFKPIPIGIENFKKLIDEGYYYVDKTLLIRDILDNGGAVNLYTRPRRFGKTLNLSMLQYYFEKTDTDNSYLFEGLNISSAGEKYRAYQGQYPVINISLKSMKQSSYEEAFNLFKKLIADEFKRHLYVLKNGMLIHSETEKYNQICNMCAEDSIYLYAIRFLSDCLYKVYQKKVIILIDEYDIPLENSYFRGFYNQMTDLIRSAFESALKTNNSLEFGILTGCLRISKESIFTGLNHLKVNSITTLDYSEYFGFTEKEVKKATEDYGVADRFSDMKQWYDGYLFGETEIYNPWSVLYFISDAKANHNALIQPYWSNTSSNDIIHNLMINGDEVTHSTVEELINGGTVIAPVYEDITYQNINVNSSYIWSFLLFTGYLKQIRMFLQDDSIYAEMCIPNREVRSIYRNTIQQWFDEKVKATSREDLFNAIINGSCEAFEDILCDWLEESISYYDGKENYYHGFLTGLVSGFKGYQIESNRESGLGRSDIMILERRRHKLAIIIEVKVADRFADLDKKCSEALVQIEEKQYDMKLKQDCYQKILKYGVAFYQKSSRVKLAE